MYLTNFFAYRTPVRLVSSSGHEAQLTALLRHHEKSVLDHIAEHQTATENHEQQVLATSGSVSSPSSSTPTTTGLIVSGGAEDAAHPPTLRLSQRARPVVSKVRQKDDTSYIICTEVQVVAAKSQLAGAGSRLSLVMPTPVKNTEEGGKKEEHEFAWVMVTQTERGSQIRMFIL